MQKQKEKCAQDYQERKKENKVLIFAEAPFFPSLRHVLSVIFIYIWLFGLHEKNYFSIKVCWIISVPHLVGYKIRSSQDKPCLGSPSSCKWSVGLWTYHFYTLMSFATVLLQIHSYDW